MLVGTVGAHQPEGRVVRVGRLEDELAPVGREIGVFVEPVDGGDTTPAEQALPVEVVDDDVEVLMVPPGQSDISVQGERGALEGPHHDGGGVRFRTWVPSERITKTS